MFEYLNTHQTELVNLGTAIIAVFSVLANIVPKDNIFGKIVHFIALNFKVQSK